MGQPESPRNRKIRYCVGEVAKSLKNRQILSKMGSLRVLEPAFAASANVRHESSTEFFARRICPLYHAANHIPIPVHARPTSLGLKQSSTQLATGPCSPDLAAPLLRRQLVKYPISILEHRNRLIWRALQPSSSTSMAPFRQHKNRRVQIQLRCKCQTLQYLQM